MSVEVKGRGWINAVDWWGLNELEYYKDLHGDSMSTEMRSISALHSPAAIGDVF